MSGATSLDPERVLELVDNQLRGIDEIERALKRMRQAPSAHDINDLVQLVRTLSSVKTSAIFLGLPWVRGTIEQAETVIDRRRPFDAHPAPEVVAALKRTVAFLRRSLESHRVGGEPDTLHGEARAVAALFAALPEATGSTGPDEFTDEELFLAEATLHLTLCREALARLPASLDEGLTDVHAAFRAIHTFKGNAAMMGLPKLEKLADALEQTIDAVRSRNAVPTSELIALSIDLVHTIEQTLEDNDAIDIGDPGARVAPVLAKARELAKETRIGGLLVGQDLVSRSNLDLVLSIQHAPLGEALIQLQALDSEQLDWALTLQRQLRSGAPVAEPIRTPQPRRIVPVEASKLDDLSTQLSSLRSMLAVSAARSARHGSSSRDESMFVDLAEVVDALCRQATGLQRVRARRLFDRCQRVAQQTAKTLNKRVNVDVTKGDSMEIHRRITDAITDPLLHIIRNAVDHGIEDTPDRLAAGKPVAGQITVSCTQTDQEVVIEVEDDGRGIDRDRILEKATAQGLVEPNSSIAEGKLLGLIFEPGFSSSDEVTNISGRGVGLDVVRTSVEGAGGRVSITSTPGSGTRLRLSFPTAPN